MLQTSYCAALTTLTCLKNVNNHMVQTSNNPKRPSLATWNNQLMLHITPLNDSVLKLPSTKMPVTVMFLKVRPPSITFSNHHLSSPAFKQWTEHHVIPLWHFSPPAGSISGKRVFALLFSFCQRALSYRSSLVTFPETTQTLATCSPHSDVLKARKATRQFTGAAKSWATYRSWAIIRINQPLKCCEHHERAAAA